MPKNLYSLDQDHAKDPADTKQRDPGTNGAVSNIYGWFQATEPTTPAAGKINMWYEADTGHHYGYDFVNAIWVRKTGWN